MSKKRSYHAIDMKTELSSSTTTYFQDSSCDQDKKMSCKKLVIILAGPTAVGKSSVGAKLCSPEMATDIVTNHARFNSMKINSGDQHIHDEILSKGHIISADSVQVYQGVEIGANKPTKEEIEQTPHHLINIVDGDSVCQYNAADWMRDALYVIDNLSSNCSKNELGGFYDADDNLELNMNEIESVDAKRRKQRIEQYLSEQLKTTETVQRAHVLPVVVGGTMMYLQWLVHGRPDAMKPSEDAIKRAASAVARFHREQDKIDQNDLEETPETNVETSLVGWIAAVNHVSSLGPIFADRISKLPGKDWYRLRRTLEVAYTFLDDTENKVNVDELYSGQREGGLDSMKYDVRCFFLCPDDRMTHTSVVDERCEDMILKGLIKETAELSINGQLPAEGQQARAIGYRQTLDYLNREKVELNDSISFGRYLDEFTTATRRYAKKQMQWFRRDEKFMFVPVKLSDSSSERVQSTAKTIRDMCVLARDDFDKELAPLEQSSDKDSYSKSYETKRKNESQGKTMKFYIGKRHKLVEGTDVLKNVIAEADQCTSRIQSNVSSQ